MGQTIPTPDAFVPDAFVPTLRLSALAALALLLGACQDPSGVGLSLIGDETSDPNATLVAADSLFFSDRAELTGGFANNLGTPLQTRALVGALQDGILGDTRATAYLDTREVPQPDGFQDRPLEEVQIRLRRGEVYGDTLASIPVEIRRITANWNPDGLPSDTTLATGPVIGTGTLVTQDSIATLDLPSEFVAANQALLRDSLDTQFEGFQITTPEGMAPGAVAAFNVAASQIRLIGQAYEDDGEAMRDTVFYPIVEVFTSLEREPPAAIDGRRLLRDGASEAFALRFDLEDFEQLPLANAGLRIPVDRALLETNDGVNRPILSSFNLFAVREDSSRTLLVENVALQEDADELVLRGRDFTTEVQAQLLGAREAVHFELVPPPGVLTLGVLPIVAEDEPIPNPDSPRRPRLSLITVGTRS